MNVHQSLTASRSLESFSPPDSVVAKADTMVRFEGVEKTYPAYRGKPSVRALQNIDFAIPRGSITGVIGRSGAGKSSLVRLINGLEKPTTGRVEVDGRDISALSGRELRLAQRSIGMIFQHFNLLSSRTAAANIALPLEIAGWSKADIAVRVAELLQPARNSATAVDRCICERPACGGIAGPLACETRFRRGDKIDRDGEVGPLTHPAGYRNFKWPPSIPIAAPVT